MTKYLNNRRATCNFIEWADVLMCYLKRIGVKFKNDMPVIPTEMLVKSVPSGITMIPSSKRSTSKAPEKTILCNFEGDGYLYGHVRNLIMAIKKGNWAINKVLSPYKQFFAVTGFDLTITPGMDQCEQDMLFLLNWLLDAVLAVNGIRVIPNLRVGSAHQAERFAIFPKGICYALGRLGEEKKAPHLDEFLTRLHIIFSRPGKVLAYGYRKMPTIPLFEEFGVEYECFDDYRHASFGINKEVM